MSTTGNSPPAKPKTIDCPTCGTPVEWIETNTFRPFCSKRCQLIDFGGWATEKHSIPVKDGPDSMSFPDDDGQDY